MATIDDDFIRRHAHSPDVIILRHVSGGTTVVKVKGFDVVIKFGRGVMQEEALAQDTAFNILDAAVVRVPKVYHFYHNSLTNIGYLAMEWIDGLPLDLHNTMHVKALQKTMNHLASLERDFPGPLASGEPQGVLWEDSAPDDCRTIIGLEDWVNKWQERCVNFRGEDLVLCHLDTDAKNILWMQSRQICLLDWASAGYYPRYFELAAHLKKGQPNEVVEQVLRSPRMPFTISEQKHLTCLIRACANSMAFVKPKPKVPAKNIERRYLTNQPPVPQLP